MTLSSPEANPVYTSFRSDKDIAGVDADEMVPPDVLVSIVTIGDPIRLDKCLAALPPAAPGLRWTCNVVDNSEDPGVAKVIARHKATAMPVHGRRGFSENHNLVLRHALTTVSPRYVLVLNDDAVLAPEALRHLVEAADREPSAGALSPRIYESGQSVSSRFRFPSLHIEVLRWISENRAKADEDDEGWLRGVSLLIRTAALQEVGVFDERFFLFYEDIDLCKRLVNAGWRCLLVEAASVTHARGASAGRPGYSRLAGREARRSRRKYFRKHVPGPSWVVLDGMNWASSPVRWVRARRSNADDGRHRSAQLRVVQTPPRYWPYTGGVESVTREVSRRLKEMDVLVTVICADEPRNAPSDVDGVRVIRLPWRHKLGNTNLTPRLPLILFRHDFDVLHTHLPTPWTCDLSCVIGRIRRKRVLVTYHNEIVGQGHMAAVAWVYRSIFQRLSLGLADTIIVLTHSARDQLAQKSPRLKERITVVPNGVDTGFFVPPLKTQDRSGILFVAVLDAFHDFKGLDDLLQAMRSIPDTVLTVVGGGGLLHHYESRAEELGIHERVAFMGHQEREQLPYLYQRAAVLAAPSKPGAPEGLPLVVLEALSSGLPVVTSAGIGPIAETIVAAGAGCCVAGTNPEHLAAALREVLSNELGRATAGIAGRKLVESRYSWDRIVEELLLPLYRES